MHGLQSPWEPQGASSLALPLAFGLSLQDWERMDAVAGSVHADGPDSSRPAKRIKMLEMKKTEAQRGQILSPRHTASWY